MSEQLLVQHCSPTLAGLKTGSLFTCACGDGEAMGETVARWNQRLAGKGLRLTMLRRRNGRALLYLFRPERLRRDLCRDGRRRCCGPVGMTAIVPKHAWLISGGGWRAARNSLMKSGCFWDIRRRTSGDFSMAVPIAPVWAAGRSTATPVQRRSCSTATGSVPRCIAASWPAVNPLNVWLWPDKINDRKVGF